MENKHAFLVIAHKDDLCFRTLLEMIDDCRNDIFIHMDSKCKDYNPLRIVNSIKHSSVYHIDRQSVTWGGV